MTQLSINWLHKNDLFLHQFYGNLCKPQKELFNFSEKNPFCPFLCIFWKMWLDLDIRSFTCSDFVKCFLTTKSTATHFYSGKNLIAVAMIKINENKIMDWRNTKHRFNLKFSNDSQTYLSFSNLNVSNLMALLYSNTYQTIP